MKILITGATGFVGRRLTLRLRRDGHQIVALTRSPRKASDLLGPEVAPMTLETLEEQRPAVDAVINLAGEPIVGRRWTRKQKQRLVRSRVDLTRRVLEGVSDARVVLSASAVGVYGLRRDTRIDEQSELGNGFVADLCRDWEQAARDASAAPRKVLLRIGLVLGQDGGLLAPMAPLFKLGLGGPIAGGKQWMPWIHLDDVVEAIVFALHNDALEGPVNLVGPAPRTNREFAKAMGSVLRRPAFLPAPYPALRVLLGESAKVVAAGQNVHPTKLLEAGFSFRYRELGGALRDIFRDDRGWTA